MKFIVPIIFVIIAIGVFFGFTDARYEGVKELRAQEAQFDEALDRSKELIALRDALLNQYNSFSTNDLDRLNTLLPDHIDNVRLIIDINQIAAQYDLSLLNIAVSGSEAGGQNASIGPRGSGLGELKLSFSVNATYERFLAFMADLERSLRVIDVTSVTFGESNDLGFTNYNVGITTYWLK